MKRVHRAGIVIFAAAVTVSSAACTKTTLKGQIAASGPELRNIAVRVIPEKDIADYLAKKVPEALTALDERRTAFEESGRTQDAAIRDYQMASGGASAVVTTKDGVQVTSGKDFMSGDRTYTYDPTKHTRAEAESLARAGFAEASQQRAANVDRFAAQKPTLGQAMTAGRDTHQSAREWLNAWETDMLADLPQKGTVVYTDEKGRFTVKVPRGGKVAVFASGDFGIGNTILHRAWGLWVKADEAEQSLTLDDNNMLLAEPSASVLR